MDFVYEGAHMHSLIFLLLVNKMAVEEWNKQ